MDSVNDELTGDFHDSIEAIGNHTTNYMHHGRPHHISTTDLWRARLPAVLTLQNECRVY